MKRIWKGTQKGSGLVGLCALTYAAGCMARNGRGVPAALEGASVVGSVASEASRRCCEWDAPSLATAREHHQQSSGGRATDKQKASLM